MGDLRSEPDGDVVEEKLSSLRSSFSPPSLLYSLHPTEIAAANCKKAEEATRRIIAKVQPTGVSERRREAIIGYVQRLIRACLGSELQVFPFGSVPLKTYLPDGDIDLTVFGGTDVEESLSNNLCSVLDREGQRTDAEFVVKDVQLIRAEVKLVKCLIQNVMVDISFNQLGGLCTLCFLEQVDRLIDKDHLFKRSIILIKAWCYYESRILGAHHGLISTYALETLVLYIFHLFHTSLTSPLEVLYKFLDHFSTFDWDNYCISLKGPVRVSSLPELVVETPENGGGDLLLSIDFLKSCAESFSVPARGHETNTRMFPQKHLNIIDPLKENNNLGRSVSKGNFYRIRSAFTLGARKLRHIFSQLDVNIKDDIYTFFSSTLDRHGGGQRPDVQDPVQMTGYSRLGVVSFLSGSSPQEDKKSYESESEYSSFMKRDYRGIHEGPLQSGGANANTSIVSRAVNEPHGKSIQGIPSAEFSKVDASSNRTNNAGNHISESANGFVIPRIETLAISNDAALEESASPSVKLHNGHHYFSHVGLRNGEMINENPDVKQSENSSFSKHKTAVGNHRKSSEEVGFIMKDENHVAANDESLAGSKYHPSNFSSEEIKFEEFYPQCYGHQPSTGNAESPDDLNHLSDLSGDYDSHLNSLNYVRWCHDYAALNGPMLSHLPLYLPSTKPWDVIRPLARVKNPLTPMSGNALPMTPAFYPRNPSTLPGGLAFLMEEMPKPRGTGTYFPNMNLYKDRQLTGRGRNQGQVRSPRNIDQAALPLETNLSEKNSHLMSRAEIAEQGECRVLCPGDSSGYPAIAKDSVHQLHKEVENGFIGHPPLETALPENSRQPLSFIAALSHNPSATSKLQKLKPESEIDCCDRIPVPSYELKDDDFPPLSI